MTRRILAGYLGLVALVLVMLTVPLGLTFTARERDRLRTAIERDARVLAAESDDAFEEGGAADLPGLVDGYVEQTGGRVVMVDAEGRSVIDSADPSRTGRDFSTRPEIASALAGRFTTGERPSKTLGTDLLFVAVPIRHESGVLGVVRVSYPATTVDERVREVWLQLVGLDVIVLCAAAVAAWVVARTLTRPVDALERTAERLANGDLSARITGQPGPADLARVASTFNTMADRLESLVDSRQAFVADASHQLRTPLTALRLRLESATAAQDTPSADLAAAANEVDRLSDLVDALLSMARLDAHTGDVGSVDVSAVTRERVATWATLADEQGVHLRLDDATEGTRALMIDGGLEQILDNLIDNALGHTPTGGRIVISGTVTTDDVVLNVGDDGPGVPDDQLPRLFDRFWRGPASPPGGTGLGLAVVQRLAEASGGTVSARRSALGGLAVEVTLRRADRIRPGEGGAGRVRGG